MQVRCKVYGLAHASLGIDCTLERDLLAVGQNFQYHDRTYVIVSVVAGSCHRNANVVLESQHRLLRRATPRRQENAECRELFDGWRQRALQAERHGQLHEEAVVQLGERLDRLMAMLEHLTKEPEAHQHEQPRPVQRRRGGEHVR